MRTTRDVLMLMLAAVSMALGGCAGLGRGEVYGATYPPRTGSSESSDGERALTVHRLTYPRPDVAPVGAPKPKHRSRTVYGCEHPLE